MAASAPDVARRAQALGLAAGRRRRRLGELRAELGRRQAARERAWARCEAKQRELDAAAAEMQVQRDHLDALCSRAFSSDEWLLGLGVLDVLGEKRATVATARRQLDEALAKADAQIAAMRAEIAAAQARIEVLDDSAASLRTRHAARLAECEEEAAIEDAQARTRVRAAGLS